MNCMYRILHNPVTAVALTFSTNYFFCYWSLISINLIISFLLSLICTSPFYLLYLMLSITSINIPQFLFSHSHFLLNMSKKVCWSYHLLNTFYTSSTRGYSARDCSSLQYFSTSVHLDNKGVILGWRGYALNTIPLISPYCETHLKWIREQHNLCLFEYFRLSCLCSCPPITLLSNLI